MIFVPNESVILDLEGDLKGLIYMTLKSISTILCNITGHSIVPLKRKVSYYDVFVFNLYFYLFLLMLK